MCTMCIHQSDLDITVLYEILDTYENGMKRRPKCEFLYPSYPADNDSITVMLI